MPTEILPTPLNLMGLCQADNLTRVFHELINYSMAHRPCAENFGPTAEDEARN